MTQRYYLNIQDRKIYALQMDGIIPKRKIGPIDPKKLDVDPATLKFYGEEDKTLNARHFVRLCDDEKKRLREGITRHGKRTSQRAPHLTNRFSFGRPNA